MTIKHRLLRPATQLCRGFRRIVTVRSVLAAGVVDATVDHPG